MSWTGFPAIQTTDWSALTFVEQFVKAVSERRRAIGQAALSNPAVGWDVQSAATSPPASTVSWRYLQDLLEALVTSFVNSHDSGGNIRATDYYDGRATIDMWTLSAWRTAAGLNASGFTRKTTAGTFYGKMVAGDYIGPWIFNELKAGLDLLVWTKPSASWNHSGSDNWAGDGGEMQPTWAGTKTYAESEFAGLTGQSGSLAPYAFTFGEYDSGSSRYRAEMQRAFNYGLCTIWQGVKRTVDYYAKAVDTGDVFDAHGDDVIQNMWSLWNTTAFTTTGSGSAACKSSSPLGNITVQPTPWCLEPNGGDTGRGWGTDDEAVIARWNVTNGFVYV